MTDQPILDTDGEDERIVTLRRSEIRSIERKAKERDTLAEEVGSLRRRLAFAEAGLPLGDKRISYFVKGYEGELDRDSIIAAAVEAGFLSDPSKASPEDQTTLEGQVERQALQAVYSASQGAGSPQVGDVERGMEQAMQEGGSAGLLAYMQQHGIPMAQGD